MTLEAQIKVTFGLEFAEAADIFTLRQFHHNNAYCVDENGELIGLCAVENDFTQVALPSGWTKLQYLNLSSNEKLQTLTFEHSLSYLEHLDLSDCELEKIQLSEGFDQLRWLDLSRNAIQTFIPEGAFPALEHLDLSDNQLEGFSARFLERCPRLERIYLKGNPLDSTKLAEVNEEANCLAFLERFLRELNKGETTNKEHKVLIVGNGGVGKSTLVERMVHNTFRKHYSSTQGIALEQYDKQADDFILNLWDFGGQDIYHATHRLFMQADAIYLLLWDEETTNQSVNEDGYPNYSLEYWLHYIDQQGADSPVIVIKTKEPTRNALHPNQAKLLAYRDDLSFIRIDSELNAWGQNGFRNLLGNIQDIVEQKPVRELSQNWADLRQYLRERLKKGEKVLTAEAFRTIATEQFDVEVPMKVLLNWLVPTGVVFYRSGYFHDNILLDQNWALRAIYSIFDRSKDHFKRLRDNQKGHFTGQDLQNIWAPRNYTESEQQLLVEFMLSCDICFELRKEDRDRSSSVSFGERQFIAPQLLPDELPTSVEVFMENTPASTCLHIRYEHDFLHYGVIQSFIVRSKQLANVRDIWQQGILIKSEKGFALVRVEQPEHAKAGQKHIHLISMKNDPELFSLVRNTLESLQEGEVTEWVSRNGRDFLELETLKKTSEVRLAADTGKVVEVEAFQVFLQKSSQQILTNTQEEVIQLPTITSKAQVKKILYLAANPTDQMRLECDREYRRLKAEMERGRSRDNYEFLHPQFAVTVQELIRAMNDHPTVVHFSGHGLESGIIITTEDNQSQSMPLPALRRLFAPHRGHTELVILNACYSASQAKEISRFGMYVIGNNNPIEDPAAVSFSTGLYIGLGEGKNIQDAFNDAMITIETQHPSAAEIIEVWKDGEKLDW